MAHVRTDPEVHHTLGRTLRRRSWVSALFWGCVLVASISVPVAVKEVVFDGDYVLTGEVASTELEARIWPFWGSVELAVYPSGGLTYRGGDHAWTFWHSTNSPLRAVGPPWNPGVDVEKRWTFWSLGYCERIQGGSASSAGTGLVCRGAYRSLRGRSRRWCCCSGGEVGGGGLRLDLR